MSTIPLGIDIDIETLPRTLVIHPPLSDAEFEALCLKSDLIQLERTKDGVIHMHSPTGRFTGSANSEITRQLRNWWHTHRRGEVYDSSTGFFLSDGSMFSPDGAYVTADQLKGFTREDEGFLRLCPAFVIELQSRSDSLYQAKRKMELWMENGAELGWLLNPSARTVYCYKGSGRVEDLFTIFTGSMLHGTYPVEGFTLDLEEVWRCYEG